MATVSFQIYTFAAKLLAYNSFRSLRIFLFLIFIPSLSWGLTFKNGEQVEKDIKINSSNNIQSEDRNIDFEFSVKIILLDEDSFEINISSGYSIRDTGIFNISDVNNDGIDDFIVGTMVDAKNYGVSSWNSKLDEADKLPLMPIYLIYSNPNNKYDVISLPKEVWSKRLFDAKSFKIDEKYFIVLARNGEIGQPKQNPGEKVAVVELKNNKSNLEFNSIFFEDNKTVTPSVDYFLDDEQRVKLVISNYNQIQNKTHKFYGVYDSVIYDFDPSVGLVYSGLVPFSKDWNAHNTMRVYDIDGDNRIDFMGSIETWFYDTTYSSNNKTCSYVVLNWLDRNNDTKICLEPAFKENHAGFDLEYLKIDNQIHFVEVSSFEHENKREHLFVSDCTISFYKLDDKKIMNEKSLYKWFYIESYEKIKPGHEQCSMTRLYKYDFDKDGILDIFLGLLDGRKSYFSYKNNKWEEIDLPHSTIGGKFSSKEIDYIILENKKSECIRVASTYNWEKTKNIRVHVSNCL